MGNGKHLFKSNSGIIKSHLTNRQRSHRAKFKNRHNNQQVQPRLSENLSFCGCGFLGIYHVGVASCFHEYAPQISMHKISGSSAGALVAVAHICGNLQLAYATTDILRVAIDARARTLGPFHPSFDINALVRNALERGLPDDVHSKVSGKLHISLTRVYDGENIVISKFDSKEDVIQALICSCFIPFWSGLLAPKYKGVSYIDGGFSNNLLILDDKTVTVSPFAGEADICPQDDVYNLLSVSLSNTSISITPHNLYRLSNALLPPPPDVLSSLCEQGFADGIRYLQQAKLISCAKCLEIRSSNLLVAGEATDKIFSYHNGESSSSSASLNSDNLKLSSKNEHQDQTLVNQVSIDDLNGLQANGENASDSNDDDNCDGCDLRRQSALSDPLPKQFSDRIREACDKEAKSLYNWLYSHKPIKYLSYLAAPYYLPMNISFALFLKYCQQLPFIGSELAKCANELKNYLIEMIKKMHEKSTTSLLIDPGSFWREEEALVEKEEHSSSAESSISVKITADCRRSTMRSLTTYECCLTIVLFGRDSSNNSKCM